MSPTSYLILLLMPLLGMCREEFKKIYMTESCNSTHTRVISGRFESNYGLTYSNLMNCYVHMKAPRDRRLFLQYRRFELEEALGAACVDRFSIYDGDSDSRDNFYPGNLCGTHDSLGAINTSSADVFIAMATDNTAVSRGVEIILTAFYEEPCNAGDYNCTNGMCIDARLECDHINHCGDNSDEAHCTAEDLLPTARDITLALAIGCGLGGLVLLLIAVLVIVKVCRYYWLLRYRDDDLDNETLEGGDRYRYPVTDMYSKYDVGYRGRRQPTDLCLPKRQTRQPVYHDNPGIEEDDK